MKTKVPKVKKAYALPVDLVKELAHRATDEGLPVNRYVERILTDALDKPAQAAPSAAPE